jgi:hypothetical protein
MRARWQQGTEATGTRALVKDAGPNSQRGCRGLRSMPLSAAAAPRAAVGIRAALDAIGAHVDRTRVAGGQRIQGGEGPKVRADHHGGGLDRCLLRTVGSSILRRRGHGGRSVRCLRAKGFTQPAVVARPVVVDARTDVSVDASSPDPSLHLVGTRQDGKRTLGVTGAGQTSGDRIQCASEVRAVPKAKTTRGGGARRARPRRWTY